ncbi:MAG TPA: 23S rRNA (pseudouridine(1915)-N(3))-methyltransferase RlmH [Acholeplasmatales bacterium]|nr:MAG: 23S rRNA (pseudouridine(1915)-N(3))-methyltransferase RlmH [Tenericutes bacterium GWF2_57_13]HAQ57051.1 23S rRNA (pseudouridine(1915)-N(3))-methyltransferase RlmH [Acholeplasmatales bacterium]
MAVTLLSVGKLKENYLREGVAEYAKRLAKFCTFDSIEVADVKIPDDPSPAEAAKVLETEGAAILARLPKNTLVIALAVEGGPLSSPAFADLIGEAANRGTSRICFVIGGSLGLSEAVKHASDRLLSFSPMTFPHQLMRLLFIEQLYRAFTILHHQTYHK